MTENVIYYGSWHIWYICAKCPYAYGYEDPLYTHNDGCCPNCGVPCGKYTARPPSVAKSRRWVCTYKPTLWEKIFLLKKEKGYYEFREASKNDSESSGPGIYGVRGMQGSGLDTTTAFAAASVAIF